MQYDWLGDLKHLLACPEQIETFAAQFAARVAALQAGGAIEDRAVVEAAARDAYDRGWGDGWRGMLLHDGREHGIKAAVANALRAAQEPPRAKPEGGEGAK